MAINFLPSEEKDAMQVIRLIEDAGPIWTPLQVSGGASMEKLEKFGSQSPMGRPGQPAELASIYVPLAADDASYTTGHIYGAAGGGGRP